MPKIWKIRQNVV